MVDSVDKKRALTSTERGRKRDQKLKAKFGLKKRYYWASATQRQLVKRLMEETNDTHEGVINEALKLYGRKHGLTLKQMKLELERGTDKSEPTN